jgi:DNA polymerase I-like protein with 3'-5' exonuclease and polymerase domains
VHGTETGRFSSSNPNMQNVNEEARFMYIPRNPGGRIISVDYSGIENRLVAYLAGDRRRLKWFENPKFSEHTYLAGILEEVPYESVVKSKEKDSFYAISKAIVHGADRMRGAKSIWEKNDMDPDRVKKVLFSWKEQIRDTVEWQRRVAATVAATGWAVNPFGRKMWFWETNAATRIVSFFPQSTAFDVLARVMIGLMHERIGWPREWAEEVCPVCIPLPEGAMLDLQVHDELVVETVDESTVQPTLEVLRKVMTQPWKELNGLSLPIGEGVGPSWGECE